MFFQAALVTVVRASGPDSRDVALSPVAFGPAERVNERL